MQAKVLFFYGVLFSLAGVIWIGFLGLPSGLLEVSVLDVGQGDAIFVRTPTNQKILIDAGPASNLLAPLSSRLGYFERRLDLIVLTHPDLDHIAGFSEILRRYEVANVLLTGVVHETAAYGDILDQFSDQKIPVHFARADRDFDFGGGVTFDIVWPTKDFVGLDPVNNNMTSIVGRLTYGETSILLTGDAEKEAEEYILLTPANLASSALKLGHHGAKTSSSEDFLNAVNSKIALVSAGLDNQFGHPHAEVLERITNQNVYSTIENGTVTLVSDGAKWMVEKER